MDEMREKSGNEQQGEIEKIDLIEFLRSFQYGIKKMWWLVLVLALIFGLNSYIKARKNYTPVYTASATVAVTTIDGSPAYQNNASAQQMADVFPYILTSGVLKDVVAKDMKLDSVQDPFLLRRKRERICLRYPLPVRMQNFPIRH